MAKNYWNTILMIFHVYCPLPNTEKGPRFYLTWVSCQQWYLINSEILYVEMISADLDLCQTDDSNGQMYFND